MWTQLVTAVLLFGSVYAVLTLALNLQYARGGMINFGIVAYFAAGAYAYAIVTQDPPTETDQYMFGFAAPWWMGLIGAAAASFTFAVITGWPTLRLRGEYLALTTFAFAEVLGSLLLNDSRIGNGNLGLSNIRRPDISWTGLDDSIAYALAAMLLMIVTMLLFRRILASPYGRVMDAIHDDELATQAIGKRVTRIRLEVFLISAVPVGLAGAMYAMITTLVAPSLYTAEVTFTVWIALVIGGERTILGAILGTMLLILIQEGIRVYPFETVRGAQMASSAQEILTGILFIVILRWQPFQRLFRKERDA
ncbi:branched-chain amino acid ABC transporter permease [Dongia sp.]|uniref:branched-chain amino acid ABC transporter permease n=1 Tax=Dongia sp. TaxID=1977262 RepID=UPI00375231B2